MLVSNETVKSIYLEYANIVWDICTIENKCIEENIQLEAVRIIITCGAKRCSIQRLYDETKWEILRKKNPSN